MKTLTKRSFSGHNQQLTKQYKKREANKKCTQGFFCYKNASDRFPSIVPCFMRGKKVPKHRSSKHKPNFSPVWKGIFQGTALELLQSLEEETFLQPLKNCKQVGKWINTAPSTFDDCHYSVFWGIFNFIFLPATGSSPRRTCAWRKPQLMEILS